MTAGWPANDPYPPHVDVGVPGFTEPVWPILDGNHRICAAAAAGHTAIDIETGGCLDAACR